MRISPIILLLCVMLGCDSGTEPAKPPAESGGNQAQQQKVVTLENHPAEKAAAEMTPAEKAAAEMTPAEKAAVAAIKKHMTPDQLALGDPVVNSVGMKLVPIPAGEFQMGSPDSDKAALANEKPQHLVKITKPFYLSVYEVTQQQYEKVMGDRPWQGKKFVKEGPDYAATHVNWDDAVEFCRKLSEQEGVEYRLPTEAQWEYACRAGTTTVYSFGDDASKFGQYAWYDKNTSVVGEKYAHRVGQKLPNPWGLYDMHGNLREWVQDWYDSEYYQSGEATDPKGPQEPRLNRVFRGGNWSGAAGSARSAYRGNIPSSYHASGHGFRLVRMAL